MTTTKRPARRDQRRVDLRVPAHLYDALKAIAAAEGRSLNAQVQYVVRQWLKGRE